MLQIERLVFESQAISALISCNLKKKMDKFICLIPEFDGSVTMKRAYLQIRVHESLWPFQTVMIKGKRYCLTCLGFGLNVAPLIMTAIIKTILMQDESTVKAASAYVDDIYVNVDIMSANVVKTKLQSFGLISKDPKRLKDGALVLGLEV